MAKLILWSLLIVWMAVIYILSDQPAGTSNDLSKKVSIVVAETIRQTVPQADVNPEPLNRTVREMAHFFAFFVLALLCAAAFRQSGLRECVTLSWAFAFCVLYAILDEWHQRYVPGRGAELADVLVDAGGEAVALALRRIANVIKRRRKLMSEKVAQDQE
jgi:VanZ family protein